MWRGRVCNLSPGFSLISTVGYWTHISDPESDLETPAKARREKRTSEHRVSVSFLLTHWLQQFRVLGNVTMQLSESSQPQQSIGYAMLASSLCNAVQATQGIIYLALLILFSFFLRQYRLTVYRYFLEWILQGERLGRGNRLVLPACVVQAIRAWTVDETVETVDETIETVDETVETVDAQDEL